MANTKQKNRQQPENTPAKRQRTSTGTQWKKDLGGTDSKTSYNRLWDFLINDDGKYLCAFKSMPWRGKTLDITRSAVGQEAYRYFEQKGATTRTPDQIQAKIYELDREYKAALALEFKSGEGDYETKSLIERQEEICPRFKDADKYYQGRGTPAPCVNSSLDNRFVANEEADHPQDQANTVQDTAESQSSGFKRSAKIAFEEIDSEAADDSKEVAREYLKAKIRVSTRKEAFTEYADKHDLSLEERDSYIKKILDEELST
ncbi:hypothetical protein [Parasitella parasitica]|uniref:Uncharacterized protein n=1 Tax=Parasitella parasitica TaxID=35722 RepID=A0A0B7NJ50_9FUNG|nr:hypothetical protein [Parasitella parasitica]